MIDKSFKMTIKYSEKMLKTTYLFQLTFVLHQLLFVQHEKMLKISDKSKIEGNKVYVYYT